MLDFIESRRVRNKETEYTFNRHGRGVVFRFLVFTLRIRVSFRNSPYQPSIDPQMSLRLAGAPRTTFESREMARDEHGRQAGHVYPSYSSSEGTATAEAFIGLKLIRFLDYAPYFSSKEQGRE